MKLNRFFKGAIVLIIFNLIGKILGAVYRIPLAKILGGVGMGQYQLVFPLYCLILTISTSGMPIAISKLVAEYNSKKQYRSSKKLLFSSILFLTIISFIGAFLVVLNAKIISAWQGNSGAYICYYGIAPAIIFVGVLSAFRGYFQGNLLMFPTAISGLIEQIVKIVLGLYLANKFSVYGTEYAVFGALLGISISELFAFLFLFICYLIYSRSQKKLIELETLAQRAVVKELFHLAVPITLGGLIAPITSMLDSLIVVNLLMFTGYASETATMLLGLQSGVVEPLVNIPVIISVSIATAMLPEISKLNITASKKDVKSLVERAYQITLSISLACAICFVIFGRQILGFLYSGSFSPGELTVSLKLLFLGCFNIIFLSLVQVTSSVLQGLNYSKYPVKSLLIGCGVKLALDFALIVIPSVNILGAIISGGACYLTVFILNYKKVKKLTGASLFSSYFYISIQASFVSLFAFFANHLCLIIMGESSSMFVAGFITVCMFLITYYVFFMSEENKYVPENSSSA